MNRILAFTLGGLVAIPLLLWSGGTFLVSSLTEKGFEGARPEIEKSGVAKLGSYKKGFLSSETTTIFESEEEEGQDLHLKHKIYHGPLALAEGMKPCKLFIVTTLEHSKLPDAAQKWIERVYGEEEPFVVKTTIPYSGPNRSTMELTRLDIAEDDVLIRFDGGGADFVHSDEGDVVEGKGEITSLYMKVDNPDDDGYIVVRTDPTNFDVDVSEERGKMAFNGKVGSTKVKFRSAEGQMLSFEIEEGEIKNDYESSRRHPEVLLGESLVSFPAINFSGEFGEFSLKGLSVNHKSTKSGTKMDSVITYSIEDLVMDGEQGIGAMFGGIANGGVQFEAGVKNMTMDSANALFAASGGSTLQSMAKEVSPEESAEMMKAFFEGVDSGTSVLMNLKIGESTNAGINFEYKGSQKLTSQKTIGDVVKSLAADINAELPLEMVDNNPILAMFILPQIEAGMVVKDDVSYKMSAKLADAQLAINGQPSPMMMMFEPMFAEKMDWDGFFAGIAESIEEKTSAMGEAEEGMDDE